MRNRTTPPDHHEVDHHATHQREGGGENQAGQLLTAVDLGSNSFYMLQANVRGGVLTPVHHERESVRLVAGVDDDGHLDPARLARALECLERFGATTRSLPHHAVRVVATSAARRLAQPQTFLRAAGAALGHPVEIIDGQEEGRLAWLGASAALPVDDVDRLVIDIGGGSTECITGRSRRMQAVASINIGCIVVCTRYFADGQTTPTQWQRAQEQMLSEIRTHRTSLDLRTPLQVWGTSGSVRAVAAIMQALGCPGDSITPTSIAALRERLLDAQQLHGLDLPGAKPGSAAVIAGTTAVLDALFQGLGLEQMALCRSSMREGVILDLARQRAKGAQTN